MGNFLDAVDTYSRQKYMADKIRKTMKLPPRRVKMPGGNQPPTHVPVFTSVTYHGALDFMSTKHYHSSSTTCNL